MTRPYIIGICGGIGSGKSVIRRLMSLLLSAPSYDCDSRAKALYYAPGVRRQVADLLGEDPIDERGELRKDLLRRAVSDYTLRPQLEKIVHSAVREDFATFVARAEAPFVLIESAILYTSGLDTVVDRTILVESAPEQRADRAVERDDEAEKFATMDSLQRRERELSSARADYRIDNSGSTSLILQCEAILAEVNKIK